MFAAHTIPNAFTPDECARISGLAEASGMRAAGLVGQIANCNIRRARIAWIDDIPETGWIMERLIHLMAEANRQAFDFALTEFSESPQVALYGADQEGHFSWHSDIGDGPVAQKRKLTLVVQLSDPGEYEGGALELMPDANIIPANRDCGAATVFPSFVLHRVTPVTEGQRQSLTVWAHGPAFR